MKSKVCGTSHAVTEPVIPLLLQLRLVALHGCLVHPDANWWLLGALARDLSSSGPVVPRKQAWLQASTSPTMVLVNVSGLTCIDNVSPAVSPPPPPPDPPPPKSSFAPVLDESPQHFMGSLQQLSDEEHPHPEGSKSNDS